MNHNTKYNNKDKQKIFENKVLFLEKFKKYVKYRKLDVYRIINI